MGKKKVVVVGLDGLEPSIVESMLAHGDLPNLSRLRAMGSYTRMKTTYPAQTPVAWSSFATGVNPGGHGIFDFIRRDPETYLPDLALSRFERPKSMLAQPKVVSRRNGIAIWQHLTNAGIPSTVLRCPCTFPPDTLKGTMLAGVGVPDLRGGQGTGAFYTQDKTVAAQEHENLVPLEPGNDLKTYIVGPRNLRANPPGDFRVDIRVQKSGETLRIETGGSPAVVELRERCWSPWIRVKFKLSMLQSASGMVRFYVRRLSPVIEFYVSPVNFDPAAPVYPISSPPDYAKRLSEEIGLFATLGMAEDHNGLNNGRFDEADYLAQCNLVYEEREKMMDHELRRFSEGFFFVLFDTPDRLQHMLWRFRDPEHPGFHRDLPAELGEQVNALYRRCDETVGRVMERLDEDTLLIALSDHGFNSFRRSFHTNTWLWQNGLLALKDGRTPSTDLKENFIGVDWSKTYAYALGLGGIYLNMKGREREGILEEGTEADRVRNAITTGMQGLIDAAKAVPGIRSVSRREEIYSGAYAGESPDLLINFQPGYRVSWETAVGGFSHQLFEDNTRRWSGDHIIDPEAVPGILFMNRKAANGQAKITDLSPTILQFLNAPGGDKLEGKALLVA
ncbi:MAG TPA: alkaline phosphatase family protein [Verrucomicrobiae bacterium]|nr:alkaline phosphatase family protein [Verrucomicrobiae bacterium]